MPFDFGNSKVLRSNTSEPWDAGKRVKLSNDVSFLAANTNKLLDPKSREGVIDIICTLLCDSYDNELRNTVEVLIETFINLNDADAANSLE